MTETSPPTRRSGHFVTAVLVCHDGAQWLPDVLDALAAQTWSPDRFVAVDTGSSDQSASLIADSLAADTVVVSRPVKTAFGDAVQAGLDAFGPRALGTSDARQLRARPARAHDSEVFDLASEDWSDDPGVDAGADWPTDPEDSDEQYAEPAPVVEWVWLLHDDCSPDPTALEELLYRIHDAPSVWMVGPKVRGWDGARLLEAGLTIDATGHVDTGFDDLELDQGQRDDIDEVMAVGTAGALIRRDVWDRLGGLDRRWPTYAGDVDFGWRVNAAGGRVVVATNSIVRHVRAQTVGRRPTAAGGGSPAALRRRSGMQVVLCNTSPLLVIPLLLRYLIGGPLRAAGLLVLARRPAQALAELRAVAGVFTQPFVIVNGRQRRSSTRTVSHLDLHHLLPRASRRWRSSPFRISRLLSEQATAVRQSGSAESGPVSEESESLALGESIVGRFFSRPATVLFLAMALLALIAERHLISSTLHGGRLLPAPAGASDLWSTYTSAWHASGVGSVATAPPSLAVLALLSSIALGKVWLVVDVLMLGAVPFAALSAFTAARALTKTIQVRIWAAVVYALLPAVTGGIAGGRIDIVVAAIVLPQVMRVIVAAFAAEAGARQWRRAVGAGLLLALLLAFAPILWLFALVAIVIGIGLDAVNGDRSPTSLLIRRGVVALVVLGVPFLALMPWSGHVATQPHLLLAGSGIPEFYATHGPPNAFSLLLLRAGGPAQPPFWIGIPILGAAIMGLTRQSFETVARVGAAILVIGIAVAIGVTRAVGVTSGLPAGRHWPGLMLLVAGAGALLSALVAAVGARPALREQSFGWRQPAAVGLVIIALLSTVLLAGSWLVRGAGRPLTRESSRVLPLFTQSELAVPTSPRALVLQANGPTISYALVRSASGPVLGDADVAPAAGSAAADHLNAAVRDLVAGRPGATAELVPFGVRYVVAPSDTVSTVRSALGRASTLSVLPALGATVWQSSLRAGELTVLSPAAATTALAGRVPTQPVTDVLNASAGSAHDTLSIGSLSSGGLLVLDEPANSDWRATVNGTRLQGRTAYGWAQAFDLPSTGGQLSISFHSGSRHVWLIAELVLVVAAVLGIVPVRRSDDEGAA